MTSRYKSGDPNGVPSGYEGNASSDDLRIPSCGIEDVDRALFNALRNDVQFQVSDNPGKQQRVPIVLAVGEKWSMLKAGRALRDKDGTLILPIVTVRRTNIEQTGNDDIVGRGMNQHTGQLVVKTRLDGRDRAYQNILNKLGLVNSEDVAGDRSFSYAGALTTEREGVKANSRDNDVRDGGLLAPKLGKNVWEIISIPTPQFYAAMYEITIWSQYTQHMNQMLECLMSSYLQTGNRTLRLDTEKGYWFIGTFGEGYASEDNADNSDGELIRKYKITVRVPGYLVLSEASGVPNGVRKYVSAPQVSFAIGGESVDTTLVEGVPRLADPYEAADDPALQLLLTDPSQPTTNRQPQRVVTDFVVNPFTGRREPRFARVIQRSPTTGETILIPDDNLGLRVVSPK